MKSNQVGIGNKTTGWQFRDYIDTKYEGLWPDLPTKRDFHQLYQEEQAVSLLGDTDQLSLLRKRRADMVRRLKLAQHEFMSLQ